MLSLSFRKSWNIYKFSFSNKTTTLVAKIRYQRIQTHKHCECEANFLLFSTYDVYYHIYTWYHAIYFFLIFKFGINLILKLITLSISCVPWLSFSCTERLWRWTMRPQRTLAVREEVEKVVQGCGDHTTSATAASGEEIYFLHNCFKNKCCKFRSQVPKLIFMLTVLGYSADNDNFDIIRILTAFQVSSYETISKIQNCRQNI